MFSDKAGKGISILCDPVHIWQENLYLQKGIEKPFQMCTTPLYLQIIHDLIQNLTQKRKSLIFIEFAVRFSAWNCRLKKIKKTELSLYHFWFGLTLSNPYSLLTSVHQLSVASTKFLHHWEV